MFKTQNGWTKAKMIAQIKLKNKGIGSYKVFGTLSATVPPMCRYRSDDDNACAVGCFIPDELYNPDLEIRALSSIVIMIGLDKFPLDIDGMICLQQAHDRNAMSTHMHFILETWINDNVEDGVA